MIGSCLQRIEKEVLLELKKALTDINYYINNYEKEIIKEQVNKQKSISKVKNKIEGLKTELKNLRRAYNREEFSYEEYIEDKGDIESELEELLGQLEEFENDDDNNTLIKYKKAVPILTECLDEYDNLDIPQKNENLKSIIARITYSKTKRLNWRKNDEDDLVLDMELKL
jgi:chromosome segregation ATPase